MNAELYQYLIYAGLALAGYLLRSWGIALPGMPATPASPAKPVPALPTADELRALILEELRKLLPTNVQSSEGLSQAPPGELEKDLVRLAHRLIDREQPTSPSSAATFTA